MDTGMEIVSNFSAIEPGTDLSRYARDLIRMHNAVIGGSSSPLQPRAIVARSWSRVLAAGLIADRPNGRALLSFDEIERRRRCSPLADVIGELTQVVAAVADASQLIMVVTDADGTVLWRAGSARVRSRADDLGFREGAVCARRKQTTKDSSNY
jgi:transcriptional regulator of acetoin/glycerol metabolism